MDGLQPGIQQGYPGIAGLYASQFAGQGSLGGSPLSGMLNSGIGGLFGNQFGSTPFGNTPFGNAMVPRQFSPSVADPVTLAYLQQIQSAQQSVPFHPQFSPQFQNPMARFQQPYGGDPLTALYMQQAQLAHLIQLIQQSQWAQQQQQGPLGLQAGFHNPSLHAGRTLPWQSPIGGVGYPGIY